MFKKIIISIFIISIINILFFSQKNKNINSCWIYIGYLDNTNDLMANFNLKNLIKDENYSFDLGFVFYIDGSTHDPFFSWEENKLIYNNKETHKIYNFEYTKKKLLNDNYLLINISNNFYDKNVIIIYKSIDPENYKKYLYNTYIQKYNSESLINEQFHIEDRIDYNFINDEELIGNWEVVDFVKNIEDFDDHAKKDLFLKGLIFYNDGRTYKPWWTWTKGLIFHLDNKTAAKYFIKEINNNKYLFFEWKSGDYTIRYKKPYYYVLKKAV